MQVVAFLIKHVYFIDDKMAMYDIFFYTHLAIRDARKTLTDGNFALFWLAVFASVK